MINKVLHWASNIWKRALLLVGINILVLFISCFLPCIVIWGNNYCVPLCYLIKSYFTVVIQNGGDIVPTWYAIIVRCLGLCFFNGGVIALCTSELINWLKRDQDGHLKHKHLKGHIVIFGDDNTMPSIVAEVMRRNPNKKILIACTRPTAEMRSLIKSKFNKRSHTATKKAKEKNIYYYQAERHSYNSVKALNTPRASKIYVVGDNADPDQDANNMRIVHILCNLHKRNTTVAPIPLTMWFSSDTSFAAMQLNDIKSDWKEMFEFRPYNFYMEWARRMFVNNVYRKGEYEVCYEPLDHGGISYDSQSQIHLIVIGMTRMGMALAREAAQLLHFSNFDANNDRTRSLITFIDETADKELDYFKERYPGYFDIAPTKYWDTEKDDIFPENSSTNNFLDIQFQFIKGRPESGKIKEWLISETSLPHRITTIAICTDSNTRNMGIALHLPEEVHFADTYNRCGGTKPVYIYVRQEKTGSMVEALYTSAAPDKTDGCYGRYKYLRPFGMIDNSYEEDNATIHAAMLFNELYEDCDFSIGSYIDNRDNTTRDETIKKHWHNLKISYQWSNIYLVDSIKYKLNSIGKSTMNPINDYVEKLAYMEHNRWNIERILMGYRKLRDGECDNMNDLEKDHYMHELHIQRNILPYNELSNTNKAKDYRIVMNMKRIYEVYEREQQL